MRWLVDEMFPADVSDRLDELGHDARAAVRDLRGLDGAAVLDVAVAEGRVLVTENVVDYVALLEYRIASGGSVATVVFALKSDLLRDPGALGADLARRLDVWAREHPEPFATAYWL